MIGEGGYDSEGHRNAQFLEATDVGPYPEECGKAWIAVRNEAMENLGMRDDAEQDGWEKMGQLAEPTPADAMNTGATKRKRRRGEENKTEYEGGNSPNAIEEVREEGRREGPETEAHSEMEEIREAVAEAILKMETNASHQECGLSGGHGQREDAA